MNIPKARYGKKGKEWRLNVFERDGYKCQHCGCDDICKLHAHHIIGWFENENLRLDINNGLTLCRSCHLRHHMTIKSNLIKAEYIPWNKGLKTGKGGTKKGSKFTEEHKDKLRKAKLGFIFTLEHKKKLKEAKTPENIEANKLRYKGKRWKIDPESGKRIWYDN